jgi:hypothetical protein
MANHVKSTGVDAKGAPVMLLVTRTVKFVGEKKLVDKTSGDELCSWQKTNLGLIPRPCATTISPDAFVEAVDCP